MKLPHVLITRFNLDYEERVSKNLGLKPSEWLKSRVELFFDFCYPSIINQSEKDFQWWVYFDTKTPKSTLDEIQEKDSEKIIQIKLCNSWGDFRGDILKDLGTLPDDCDYLINSRIDSDDALGKDTIKKIKDFAINRLKNNPEKYPFAINPLRGVIFDKNSCFFFSKGLKSNPFLSLVIPRHESTLSVFTYQHQQVKDKMTYVDLEGSKLWLQVIHDQNLLNRKAGRPIKVSASQMKIQFNFDAFPNKEGNINWLGEYILFLKRLSQKIAQRLNKAK